MKRKQKQRRRCASRIPCAPAVPGSDSYKAGLFCPEDAPQDQLRMGIEEEREHGPSRARRCRTSLDHIAKDRRYYTRLRKAKL